MPLLSTDDTNHTIGFTGVWKRGGPKLARILRLITSQNVTAPKLQINVESFLACLITAYNKTRIIPARAGQLSSRDCAVLWKSDHPRACGATSVWFVMVPIQYESSPRMRGN